MDADRALTPVDGLAGYRTRKGERYIGSYYRFNVTKLTGINYSLVLPPEIPQGDWPIRFQVSSEISRVLLYEDAVFTDPGTEIRLFNANRRFELEANSEGAGRTDAKFHVDPAVADPGNNLLDFNIPDHPTTSIIEASMTSLVLLGGRNYLIAVQPEPQLTTVSILLEIWKEK